MVAAAHVLVELSKTGAENTVGRFILREIDRIEYDEKSFVFLKKWVLQRSVNAALIGASAKKCRSTFSIQITVSQQAPGISHFAKFLASHAR